MNYNLKRHKTLSLLASSRVKFSSGQDSVEDIFGISFDELENKLRCDRTQCELIFVELYQNEEIRYKKLDIVGLVSTEKGLAAFANEKYLKANNKIMINWLKNFTQIVIPILSLTIAVIVLSMKFNSITESIEHKMNNRYMKELQRIELRLDSTLQLENKGKNHPISQSNKTE